MWGWIKPILDSLLEFLCAKAKEPSIAVDAPPNPVGLRDRFIERVRRVASGLRSRGNSSPDC